MKTLNTINNQEYRKYVILESDSKTGFRIGGVAPNGIKPTILNNHTRYLMTIPLEKGKELSLFHSFNFDDDDSIMNPSESRCCIMSSEYTGIQFVIHTEQQRGKSTEYDSELSGHSITLLEEIENDSKDTEECYGLNKMGGWPFLDNGFLNCRESVSELLQENFIHFMQLSFPSYLDYPVDGNWPFYEYTFHIFLKENKDGYDIRCIWG